MPETESQLKAQTIRKIEIRHCSTLPEYEQCVSIEHAVWGEDIAVPSAMFVVAHHIGGQVFGAFDGAKMVGFALAVPGVRAHHPPEVSAPTAPQTFMHSHMAAVLPEFQNRGIGRRLKLFQRDDALRRGIKLIEWTFDPLEPKNAHFNLMRLGAVARRFIPNCYGVTASPLHGGLPTDRLVAEWWLESQRVRQIVENRQLEVAGPSPGGNNARRISIPANFGEIKQRDRDVASRIHAETRAKFQKLLSDGYVVTSVETGVDTGGATSDYILEPASSIAGLKLGEVVRD
jgi:predicted GNAT superfamily acetyltransferase